VGSKVVVAYDACHAGSFMDELSVNRSHPHRVVLLSTGPDHKAYFPWADGELSFTSTLFRKLNESGKSLEDAYSITETNIREDRKGDCDPTCTYYQVPDRYPMAREPGEVWMKQAYLDEIFSRDRRALGAPVDQEKNLGDDLELTLRLPTPQGNTPPYDRVYATIIPPDPGVRGVEGVYLSRDTGLDTARFDGYSTTLSGYLTVTGHYSVSLRGVYEDGITTETRRFAATVCDPPNDADCDGVPDGGDNCPGDPNWGQDDEDGDGYAAACGDCNDQSPDVYPGAPEICDGYDSDCNGDLPAGEADADEDGYLVCEGDCDDNDFYVNPGAREVCNNGKDDDCDGDADSADSDCAGWGAAAGQASTMGTAAVSGSNTINYLALILPFAAIGILRGLMLKRS
jgi:hypothetical protein